MQTSNRRNDTGKATTVERILELTGKIHEIAVFFAKAKRPAGGWIELLADAVEEFLALFVLVVGDA